MPRALLWIVLLAGLILGASSLAVTVRGEAQGGPTGALAALPSALADAGIALLAAAFVGRVLLALLPPGPIGSLDWRDAASTWAFSHLLGTIVLGVVGRIAPSTTVAWMWIAGVAPWGVVAALRLATLPGAMVPRHDERRFGPTAPPHPPAHALRLTALRWGLALILVFLLGLAAAGPITPAGQVAGAADASLSALLVLAGAGTSPEVARLLVAVTWVAALLVLDQAAADARRRALPRTAWILIASLCVLPARLLVEGDPGLLDAAVFALVPAAAVGWLRQADRRSRALFGLGVLGTWVRGEPVLALACAVLLVGATAAPARARTARVLAIALGVAALLHLLAGELDGAGKSAGGLDASTLLGWRGFGILFWTLPLTLFALVTALRRGSGNADPVAFESTRELVFLLLLLLTAAVLLIPDGRGPELSALLLFSPTVVLGARALLPRRPPPPPHPLERGSASWIGSTTPTPGSPSAR